MQRRSESLLDSLLFASYKKLLYPQMNVSGELTHKYTRFREQALLVG